MFNTDYNMQMIKIYKKPRLQTEYHIFRDNKMRIPGIIQILYSSAVPEHVGTMAK